MGLSFQPSTGADPVQVTVDIEFQQISGRVTWASGLFRLNPAEACDREIKPINERVDEANRVLQAYMVVQPGSSSVWKRSRPSRCVMRDPIVRHPRVVIR